MSKKFAYDPISKTIFLKRSGELLPGELFEGIQKLTELTEFSEAKKLLSDIRDGDLSKITSAEVMEHALFCKDKLKHLSIVILAPKNLTYGLGRMFKTMSQLGNLSVVRNINDALDQLELDEIMEY